MNPWRRRTDQLATVLITASGLLSVAVLAGVFLLLTSQAWGTFQGGIEAQPLSEAERAQLGPEVVAALAPLPDQVPSPADFVTGTVWRPDGSPPRYGVGALVAGTLLTTTVALLVATPLGLATAAWLVWVAHGRLREVAKVTLELLAALPSVVLGFLGLQVLGPWLQQLTGSPGLNALNGALLLAFMALPTVVSLSEDALRAVPRELIQASLALGADRWQTLTRVAMPAASSGLFASLMLGFGRAVGETMTVLMATGNAAAFPDGLLDPVRTLTATLAIEMGEVPRGTTHYHSLFLLGALLFLITLAVNLAADQLARRQARWGGG